METPGFLELTRIPDVIVPECVVKCVSSTSVVACVSACEELKRGPTQMGDGYSEPNGPQVSISGTAPVSRDVAWGNVVRYTFSCQLPHVVCGDVSKCE